MTVNTAKLKNSFFRQAKLVKKPKPVLNKDMVMSYQVYGLSGGEWSIEAKISYDQSIYGPSIKEWVGNNGTGGYEADDLWAEVKAWEKDPNGGLAVHHWTPGVYECPDGTHTTFWGWVKELALSGKLHGIIITI